MWNDNYDWHFDYARLAFDTGFSFKNRQIKVALDRDNISNVDVNKIIQERNTAALEKYIPTLIEYNLDNDHTKILDPTFVKVFHLSQLAIEYLLFCKKYLDNTVVILKRGMVTNREEITELKNELQNRDEELLSLRRRVKELKSSKLQYHTLNAEESKNVFQCTFCLKVFASKDFLDAHIKRRHESSPSIFQEETDKLQMEIKELKERLNSTEKLVINESPKKENKNDKTVIYELQQKFDLLKTYIESELKTLQNQSFEQNKYERWFEIFLQKLESLIKKPYSVSENVLPVQVQQVKVESRKKQIDSFVQTDQSNEDSGTENKINNTDICSKCKQNNVEKKDFDKNQIQVYNKMLSNLKHLTENQLSTLESTLTEKVNASFNRLDTQMQSLNKKMDAIVTKSKINSQIRLKAKDVLEKRDGIEEHMSASKSKLSQISTSAIQDDISNEENRDKINKSSIKQKQVSVPSFSACDKIQDKNLRQSKSFPYLEDDIIKLSPKKRQIFTNSDATQLHNQKIQGHTTQSLEKEKTVYNPNNEQAKPLPKPRKKIKESVNSEGITHHEQLQRDIMEDKIIEYKLIACSPRSKRNSSSNLKHSDLNQEMAELKKKAYDLISSNKKEKTSSNNSERMTTDDYKEVRNNLKSSNSLQFLFNKGYESEASSLGDESETESTTTSSDEDELKETGERPKIIPEHANPQTKPSTSTLGQRSITSLKAAALDKSVLEGLKNELLNIVNSRLQKIGIPSESKGISHASYKRAYSLVQQQKALSEKNYPEYKKIERDILKVFDNKIKERGRTGKVNGIHPRQIKTEEMQIITKPTYRQNETQEQNVVEKRAPEKFFSFKAEVETEVNKAVLVEMEKKIEEKHSSTSFSEKLHSVSNKESQQYLEKLAKGNKTLHQSYQSYSDVIQQIKEKMKQNVKENELTESPAAHVLQNITNTEDIKSTKSDSDSLKSSNDLIITEKNSMRSERNSLRAKETSSVKSFVISEETSIKSLSDAEPNKNDLVNFSPMKEGKKCKNNEDGNEESKNKDSFKQIRLQQKSALRNYPQKPFPLKKKVLFDLESIESEIKGKVDDVGDSTSVASSVLDESPKGGKSAAPKRKDSDTSDFNFSEILT